MSDSYGSTAGLVLAAGSGRRFGGGKMLAEIGGRPMLQHVLDLAASAKLDPVVVVLGEEAAAIERQMQWRREKRLRNPDPARGLASSLQLGLKELAESDRVIVLLGDQPYLTMEQVAAVVSAPRDPERPIVVPRYGGVPGNPVLLESGAFPLAAALEGDRGMSQLFASHPNLVRYLAVPGTNPDLDTREDLAAAVVKAGYDALGEGYAAWSSVISDPARDRLVEELASRLPAGGKLLELGIGPGINSTERLSERFRVTGVDLSATQLETARRNLPNATLIQADMTQVDFPSESFDGVMALYSLNHVSADRQPTLIEKTYRWLRPGGSFLATFPASEDGGDWTGEWLGVEMFFSGHGPEKNRAMMTEAGFEIVVDEIANLEEPEGTARFQWILAGKT